MPQPSHLAVITATWDLVPAAALTELIREQSEHWRVSLVAGKADAAVALYGGDASLLPPPPRPAAVTAMPDGLVGRAAIREFVEGYIQILVDKPVLEATEIIQLGETVAEIGIWVALHVTGPGTDPEQSDGYYFRLWRQDTSGDWKIWRETFN
jgi:ketosteroid isomerase-like protein